MQSHILHQQPIDTRFHPQGSYEASDDTVIETSTSLDPVRFQGHFADKMEIWADRETVAQYLDDHQNWFMRSAHPMKVEPLGVNAYEVTIGKYGAFGYEVEPKVGLELFPQQEKVYRIKDVAIPNYVAPGYEVTFNAILEIVEVSSGSQPESRIDWQLELIVDIQFPKFIRKLPQKVLQKTGTGLLSQIVRQVSHRLTRKVQQNFYQTMGIPAPHN
ncbi:DUF1997 domain-containing protein [Merismopedia glauca]|uniref:DUF1997 domain-containing protein n=1 Tax=Merismopedia glauca CCAP 1448/3 TaxID=1296344 RepID=A0A2T1C015_9CYAN|nr:DUF1997 domain-containing protein [Merismopedia glauca]PSB01463.1 hypothetical protein C7B64_18220 [Merismopedia glauca CCAP 1448/3]